MEEHYGETHSKKTLIIMNDGFYKEMWLHFMVL